MRAIMLIPAVLFLALAGMFIFTLQGQIDGSIQREQLPSALISRPAPTTRLPALYADQSTVSIDDFQGQIRLVNFFASWCVPCRAEMPMLNEISDEITLIGIAYKDRTTDTKTFLQRFSNPYAAIGVDRDGRHAIAWGLYGVPETYLLDREGNVLFRHAGALTRKMINDTLRPLWQGAQ